MALKDWKKIGSEREPIFTNDKTGARLDIDKMGNMWEFSKEFGNKEQFKTKTQALSRAKSYMRTH